MEKSAKITFLSFILSCSVYAQTEAPKSTPPFEYIKLGQFDDLLASVSSTMSEDVRNQILGNYNSFLGRADLTADLNGWPTDKTCIANEAPVQPGSAWVLDHARDAKLIMFNENHLTLASRTFVRRHLKELQALGFTHLGFEALTPFDDTKNANQLITHGYYTIEPTFSALIREANDLGFIIFGYENTDRPQPQASMEEQIIAREKGQTQNIMKVLNAAPPDSKFIIYAGWTHISEVPMPTSRPNVKLRWMASLLKEQSGIDPVTIDLTQCSYTSDDNEGWLGRIYISENGLPLTQGTYAGAVDAQIYLPIPSSQTADSTNYYRSSLGSSFQIPDMLRSEEFPVLVQARAAGESKNSMAYDRILLRPGEDLPLYLKHGDYEITSYKGDGSVIAEQVVHIE